MPRTCLTWLVVLSSCGIGWSLPQSLVVTVVNKHYVPARPVPGIRVSLKFADGPLQITASSRGATNRKGQIELAVAPDASGRDVRIDIGGAGDLVIYQPAEGLLGEIPREKLVILLPRGSPALLEPAQVEAMLNRLSRENQELRASSSNDQWEKPDFDRDLRQWAARNGLPYDEVDQHVRAWAQDILAHKEQQSLARQAEAEYGLRHFEKAVDLFDLVVSSLDEHGEQKEKDVLAQQRQEMHDIFQAANQGASSSRNVNNFHKATETLERAAQIASRKHKLFAGDMQLRMLWIMARGSVAESQTIEAEAGSARAGLQLLSAVADEYRALLMEIAESANPKLMGVIQRDLGQALRQESVQSGGDQSLKFMQRAIAELRASVKTFEDFGDPVAAADTQEQLASTLSVYSSLVSGPEAEQSFDEARSILHSVENVFTRKDFPSDWADLRYKIANVDLQPFSNASTYAKPELLADAVTALRETLEVYDPKKTPKDWAYSQQGLCLALSLQSTRADGQEAASLARQALQACHAVVAVASRQDTPRRWAESQAVLAAALNAIGNSEEGGSSTEHLKEAVLAYRGALEVDTRSTTPGQWAIVELSLAEALANEAQHTHGNAAAPLWVECGQAATSALEVLTKASDATSWALAQNDLARALLAQAPLASGDRPDDLYRRAMAAADGALEVYTKVDWPSMWAAANYNLGRAKVGLSGKLTGKDAIDLLDQAIQAFRHWCEVRTKDSAPAQWMETQADIGEALFRKAMQVDGTARANSLTEALDVYQQALAVDPSQSTPKTRAYIKVDVAQSLFFEQKYADAVKALESAHSDDQENTVAVDELADLYHEYVIDFPRSFELLKQAASNHPTADRLLGLAEAGLTVSKFQVCLDSLGLIKTGDLAPRLMAPRDVLFLACQWGAGKIDAAETAAAFSRYTAGMPKTGFVTRGDRKYLSTAPEFTVGRPLWIKVFQALEDSDGAALADAAQKLSALKAGGKEPQ